MARLEIVKYPDTILRKTSKDVDKMTDENRRLFDEMASTMYITQGIGLAAPQVGISKKMIVVDIGEGLLKLINPKIVSRKGVSSFDEGCLSVPDQSVKVKRAEEIVVSYTDDNNIHHQRNFQGLVARVIQHEIDHLNGKLIIDYLPWYKRLFL